MSSDQTNSAKASTISRIFFLIGMLFIVPVFFVPLWQINLTAPQYPEGLTMFIHHDNVTGMHDNDLENINLLNHYIGMKKIEPDSIPELFFMKFIIGGLIGLGLIAFFSKRKFVMASWVAIALIISAAGIYDLNRWEEDYGSDLDPKAPIKVEGMTYKPPLIGEKQLLNITATSYPAIGGVLFGFAIFLASMATFMAYKQPVHEDSDDQDHQDDSTTGNEHPIKIIPMREPKRESEIKSENGSSHRMMGKAFALLLLSGLIVSCSADPSPIRYNKDQCANCSMLITEPHYGSELVTKKGKIYTFDSAECLVWFLDRPSGVATEEVKHFLVTDYSNPGNLVDAAASHFLISENLPSPMGAYLTAFANKEICENIRIEKDGVVMNWTEVIQKIRR